MSKIRDVHEIRNREDAIKWAEAKKAPIKEGANHTKVIGPNGATFLPRHKGDFATGTRFAIIKQYIAIGLGILAGTAILIACL